MELAFPEIQEGRFHVFSGLEGRHFVSDIFTDLSGGASHPILFPFILQHLCLSDAPYASALGGAILKLSFKAASKS